MTNEPSFAERLYNRTAGCGADVQADCTDIGAEADQLIAALVAERDAAVAAIRAHNDGCASECIARGRTSTICEAFTSRGHLCIACPRKYTINDAAREAGR